MKCLGMKRSSGDKGQISINEICAARATRHDRLIMIGVDCQALACNYPGSIWIGTLDERMATTHQSLMTKLRQ